MKLCATECVFDESDDEGMAYIWFADRCQTQPTYFTISREVGAADSSAYFERDDQKWGASGRVIHAHLTSSLVTLKLDAELADALGLGQEIEISFILGENEVWSLERCLVAILGSEVVTRDLDHQARNLQR